MNILTQSHTQSPTHTNTMTQHRSRYSAKNDKHRECKNEITFYEERCLHYRWGSANKYLKHAILEHSSDRRRRLWLVGFFRANDPKPDGLWSTRFTQGTIYPAHSNNHKSKVMFDEQHDTHTHTKAISLNIHSIIHTHATLLLLLLLDKMEKKLVFVFMNIFQQWLESAHMVSLCVCVYVCLSFKYINIKP